MKIGIDVSTVLNHGQDIGAGRYIVNLVRELLRIDTQNSYILTGRYSGTGYEDIFYDIKKEYKTWKRHHSGGETGNNPGNKKIAENFNKAGNTHNQDERIRLNFIKTTQKNIGKWDRYMFHPIEFRGFKADLLHCPRGR